MWSLSGVARRVPRARRVAYLNAGTDGPLPRAPSRPPRASWSASSPTGARWPTSSAAASWRRLRGAYARALGAEEADVALTTCTTEGMAQVIGGLDLGRGDEILTSDEEHPGLLGALAAARELHGVNVREVPLAEIADAVGPSTRLVACSHVGWVSGSLAPAELGRAGCARAARRRPGRRRGAVDVHALGCDAYAGAGQKWLCGPDGTGMLWVSPALRERLAVPRRGYANLADANAGLDARPARGRPALRHAVA